MILFSLFVCSSFSSQSPELYFVRRVSLVAGGEYMSLEVDSSSSASSRVDGRFLLADGVVTHNSNLNILRHKLRMALDCVDINF